MEQKRRFLMRWPWFQGLRHNEATDTVDNRERIYLPALGRYGQRDPHPEMYPDGMNGYVAYHVMHGGTDPTGMYGTGMGYGTNPSTGGYAGSYADSVGQASLGRKRSNARKIIRKLSGIFNPETIFGFRGCATICTPPFPIAGVPTAVCLTVCGSVEVKFCECDKICLVGSVDLTVTLGLAGTTKVPIRGRKMGRGNHPDPGTVGLSPEKITPRDFLPWNMIGGNGRIPLVHGFGDRKCPPEGFSGHLGVAIHAGFRAWTAGARVRWHYQSGWSGPDYDWGLGIGYGTGISGEGGISWTKCWDSPVDIPNSWDFLPTP